MGVVIETFNWNEYNKDYDILTFVFEMNWVLDNDGSNIYIFTEKFMNWWRQTNRDKKWSNFSVVVINVKIIANTNADQ